MKFRKYAVARVLTLRLTVTGPLSALAGRSTRPGAAYQPSVNRVSIYASEMGNTLTLKQYTQTVGIWPVRLGQWSETGGKVWEGDKITPPGSLYVCTRNDQGICYLILGFSYPNAEDTERDLRDSLINEEQYHAVLEANKVGVQPP